MKALARAFRYQRLLDEGRYASISEMAAAEKLERGYLGLVEAILDDRQTNGHGQSRLTEPFPTSWVEQRLLFGPPGT